MKKKGRPKKVVDNDAVLYDNYALNLYHPLDWSNYDIYLKKKRLEALIEGFVDLAVVAGYEPTWKDKQDIKAMIKKQGLI